MHGEKSAQASAKDIALEVVRQLTADGATYASIEYHGTEALSLSERMTLANLAIEAGAKVGLVPPSGEILSRYEVPAWLRVDPKASFVKEIDIDLSSLKPVLSVPYQVDNVHPVARHLGVPVDQVFIGTCTNGRLDDLHIVADILKGKQVAQGTRLLIIPASSQVLQDAAADGTLSTLLASGAILGTPGCGPCMGRHMGVLAPGEVCVSTSNRNFIGRMGSPEAQIFLASPAVAAATALKGVISLPDMSKGHHHA
ncbi:MAG: aconitase family protein [Deinococcales bacterium]